MIRPPERRGRGRPRRAPSIDIEPEQHGHHASEAREKLAELHGVAHLSEAETSAVLADRLRPSGKALGLVAVALMLVAGLLILGPSVLPFFAAPSMGYAAAILSWLLSTAQAAPILAIATRLTFGFWAVPTRRLAELHALAALVTVPLFWWTLMQRPTAIAWSGFWFDWPGAHLWNLLAVALLGIVGLMVLGLAALPDIAAAHADSAGRMIGGWRGNARQWTVLESGIAALSVCYLVLYVYVQLIVSTELALVLVPGWNSAVIPAQQVASSIAAGVGLSLLSLWLMVRAGARRLVGLDPFWNGGKMLLGLAPITLYLTWAEVLTYWYGRAPGERWLLETLLFGPPRGLFLAELVLLVLVPFVLLIWHNLRRTSLGPVIAGVSVLVGVLLDRIRIYGVSWTVARSEIPPSTLVTLGLSPGLAPPAPVDWLMLLGAPLAVVLMILLAAHWIPVVSLWEYNRDRLFRVGRPFLETAIAVIGRPR